MLLAHPARETPGDPELGWPVLPVAGMVGGTCGCRARARCAHPAKHPLIKDGTRSATVSVGQVRDWWRYWPWAGIGIVTGARSQLVVVDVDPRHGGHDTLGLLVERRELSAATLTARTGSGGLHLCYRLPAGHKAANTSGRLPGVGDTPGIDVRGDGGYIVAAPSSHRSGDRYRWDPHSPTMWAAPGCTLHVQRRPPSEGAGGARGVAGSGYAQRAVHGELARLATAVDGVRNDTLNRAAFSLGTLIGAGGLNRPDVESALAGAADAAGIPVGEAARTIRSGLDAGESRPRHRDGDSR
ncbi:MAG: bifunctional DNA primase/polymerase [Actinomycetota bacterium]|nr:bifunctional DNA primase/polymerase [Actinomycetota bacterium]